MPYRISKSLLSKLPKDEFGTADQVGQQLLDHSTGVCYLCGGPLLPASEVLQADHVTPEAEGGETEIGNLRLVHGSCNSAKRDKRFEDVSPYLQLKRVVREQGGRVKYDSLTGHFGISPKPTQFTITSGIIKADFADGSTSESPIFEEEVAGESVKYSFIQVPRVAIFNDGVVQPRPIRVDHANSIFLDLAQNPLHEPPSCRLDPNDKGNLRQIRMFDGQHKTIASWMRGYQRVTIKLYIDMSSKDANELVTSIQAKIKKLSLSPFELAAKMSDEWQGRIAGYIEDMKAVHQPASEEGFITWLAPGAARSQGKNALKNAVLQKLLDADDFLFAQFVETPGITSDKTGLKETMLKSRFLEKLLVTAPLADPLEDSDKEREMAVENIIWMSNLFLETLLDNNGGEDLQPVIEQKKARLFNQNTLEQVADLLRLIMVRTTNVDEQANLSSLLTDEQRDKIAERIDLIANHPWWRASWERDNAMRALRLANQKNQDRKKAFAGVAFDLGYAMIGADYPPFETEWLDGTPDAE